jgi:formylglycine-generating enzyme required for sulfatase activity
MKFLFLGCLLFVMGSASFAALSVDRLVVRQNWPWNPDVTATFTLAGETDRNADVQLVVSNGEETYEIPFAELTGDVRSVSSCRSFSFVWRPAQSVAVPSAWLAANKDRLAFSLKLTPVLPKYLLVDLSEGATAARYPVRALAERPAGGWSDDHKTTRLVLRHIRVFGGTTFLAGSPNDEWGHPERADGSFSAENQSSVTLTNDYYLAIFELTQKQYELMGGVQATSPTAPTTALSWSLLRGTNGCSTASNTSKAFYTQTWPYTAQVADESLVARLMRKISWTEHLSASWRLDLPTEAQWEYACRAGTTGPWGNGKGFSLSQDSEGVWHDPSADAMAWHRYNANGVLHPVGLKVPNGWDLYDMHGNAAERCIDIHLGGSSVPAGVEPRGNEFWDGLRGSWRVVRGGDVQCSRLNITEYSDRLVNYSGTIAMIRAAVRGRETGISSTPAALGVRLALWQVKGSND